MQFLHMDLLQKISTCQGSKPGDKIITLYAFFKF